METVLIIVALLAGASLACLALLTPDAVRPRTWRTVTGRRVVVNLKSGRAVDGVLVRSAGPLLFLRNSALLEPGQDPAPVDGEAVVERAQIDFIQAL